jgi:molecular chaperone GrpE (heat shock protein)
MNEPNIPRLPKWPFFVADLVLLGTAGFIYSQNPAPKSLPELALIAACIALGAWLSVAAYWWEYRASVKLAEADSLITATAQIKNLEKVAAQIHEATSQWQQVQEQANQTADQAKQMTARMTSEAKAFAEFIERANDSEKATLRLEVEKLRRAEGEWIQVLVRMLDHVYALHQGALRSAKPNLIEQVSQFQNACRDAARRVGLVPFTAEVAERFDAQRHQLLEGNGQQPNDGAIAETVASGFTFQGKLLRQALVRLEQAKAAGATSVAIEPPDDQSQLPLESSRR